MTNFSLFGIGPLELIFVLIIALVVLGPERLPQVARQLVRAWIQIRNLSSDLSSQLSAEFGDLDELKEITQDLRNLNPEKLAESWLAGEEEKEKEEQAKADSNSAEKKGKESEEKKVPETNSETTAVAKDDAEKGETEESETEDIQAEDSEIETADMKSGNEVLPPQDPSIADTDLDKDSASKIVADEDISVEDDLAQSPVVAELTDVANDDVDQKTADAPTPAGEETPSDQAEAKPEKPSRPVIDISRITPQTMSNAAAAVAGTGVAAPKPPQEENTAATSETTKVTDPATNTDSPEDPQLRHETVNGTGKEETIPNIVEERVSDTEERLDLHADHEDSTAASGTGSNSENSIAPPEFQAIDDAIDTASLSATGVSPEEDRVAVDTSEENA